MTEFGTFKKIAYLGNMNSAKMNSPNDMNRNENGAEKNGFYVSKVYKF